VKAEDTEADTLRHYHQKIVLDLRFSAQGHTETASVARHRTAKKFHIILKREAKALIAEDIREK
jgi:hypothetical protein